jgi:hypothetical protein
VPEPEPKFKLDGDIIDIEELLEFGDISAEARAAIPSMKPGDSLVLNESCPDCPLRRVDGDEE